ncbi:MAG: Gfo/Idh/MocA family oxidoreductase [Phycisphaerales bacterium]|nr:Gfo/Idh/MocA family oxidoreductase [Phycisphaerales bacterium]
MTSSESNPAKLRCGAVGVGRMGQHHARVYAEMEHIELVGVVDANLERAQEIARKHGCQAFATEQELLDAGVDAVSIAVPTTYHLKSAEPFLKSGVACLIEKPLAGDGDEAEQIKHLAEEHNACLMVGHIERFNPIMRAMQNAAATNSEPITPRFIEVHRVSPMTFRSMDVGVVMDMMIHDLDVVLMLMGGREPDEIQASGVAVVGECEDLCNARLVWNIPEQDGGGQCVANITASRLAMKTERLTRITGEGGYIKIDYAAKTGMMIRKTANELQMREVREQLMNGQDLSDLDWTELINIEPLTIDDGEPIVKEIEAFLDAVRTGEQPAIDAEAGFANVRTAERIVEAINVSLGTRAPAALS